MLLFALSAALLMLSCHAVAALLARRPDERFWWMAVAAGLQLALLAQGLSLFSALAPAAWLAAQVVVTAPLLAWAWRAGTRVRPRPGAPPRAGRPAALALRAGAWLLAGFVAFAWAASLYRLASRPVAGFDDLMYHGSRVLYALQERTIFLAPTHNERQTAFGWGGELWFLWPMLLTRAELPSRVILWLALPLSCAGVWFTAARMGLAPALRMTAVALWCATPVAFRCSLQMKPDLWMALWALAAFWGLAATVRHPRSSGLRHVILAGLALGLAVGIRQIALAFIPVAAVAALLVAPRPGRWPLLRRLAAPAVLCVAALAGCVASGAVAVAAFNSARLGGPMGSPGFVGFHSAPFIPAKPLVHTGRLVFELAELPVVPVGADALQRAGNAAASAMGVDRPLPWEQGRIQRKVFEVAVPRRALRLGLGGALWVPLALIAVGAGVRARTRRPQLAAAALALTSAGTMAAIVLKLAWRAGAMTRYLVAPFAAVPVLAAWAVRAHPRTALALMLLTLLQGGALVAGDIVAARWPEPEKRPWVDQTRAFSAAMPPDATVLLFANQDCADYLLFGPEHGLTRRVVPWGNRPVTPAALARAVILHDADWAVFDDSAGLGRHWDPPFVVAPAVEWFRTHPEWHAVPADGVTSGLLFARARR